MVLMNIDSYAYDWWRYADGFVDLYDVQTLFRRASILFRDLTVERDSVEFFVLDGLYQDSLAITREVTPVQQEALVLAEEADTLGITPATYIAQRRGQTVQSALRLLKRATMNALIVRVQYESSDGMVQYDDSTTIYNNDSRNIAINKTELGRIKRGLKYACPCQGYNPSCDGWTTGQWGICYSCSKLYGATKEDRLPRYDWVQKLVELTLAQSYKDAERIYFERHYMVNQDVSELPI